MSAERFFDDLARTLAEPMPRRRAMRVIGASLAAIVVPGLRPGMARATPTRRSDGDLCGPDRKQCTADIPSNNTPFTTFCCPSPRDQWDCPNPGDKVTKCRDDCTAQKGKPCPGKKNAAGVTHFVCCLSTDRCVDGECVPSCPPERSGCGVCCAAGQYCDRARGKCCPPDPDLSCRGPEPECKAKVDDELAFYVKKVCGKKGKVGQGAQSAQEGAFASLGCIASAELIRRPTEYGKCRQESNDKLCPSGVRCDPKSGLCMKPLCRSSFATRDWRAAELVDDRSLDAGERHQVSGPAAVRAELSKHKSAIRDDAVRVERALGQRPTPARSRGLAKALERYRADVDALGVSVEALAGRDPSARPAAQSLLVTLGYTSSGLASFSAGVRTGRNAEAIQLGREAQRSFKRAAASSRKTREALGCGSSC